jgi:hypothetical protein
MKKILGQLCRTGLLPDELATAILEGGTPPNEEVVLHLVIAAWDGYAVLTGDQQSSKQERSLAHSVLAAAFLSAMALVGEGED